MLRPSLSVGFSAFVAVLLAGSQVPAAVRTWSGAGADANWSTAGNWGGTAPVNADVLLFSGVTQQNNNNDIA
ncbi:MAG TPA: hypothetical protein VG938_06960, partial [Verrucomicrobiae bacterium]|nr:hypothetical protein [Verrucomicrobiae bacterium]